MSGFILKPEGKAVCHAARFEPPQLFPGESVTGDCGWAIQSLGTKRSDLSVSHQRLADNGAVAVLAGGKRGDRCMVTVSVDTSAGRILRQSFLVAVGAQEPALNGEEHDVD